MVTTHWKCPTCQKHGRVRHGSHAGVHEVIEAIYADHWKKARHCKALISNIQVSLEHQVSFGSEDSR